MLQILAGILKWVFSKTAMLALLWIVALGCVAAYLASQQYFDKLPDQLADKQSLLRIYEQQHQEIEARIAALRSEMEAQTSALDDRIGGMKNDLNQRRGHIASLSKKLETLRGMAGRAVLPWEWLRGANVRKDIEAINAQLQAVRAEEQRLSGEVAATEQEKQAIVLEVQTQEAGLVSERDTVGTDLETTRNEVGALQAQVNQWQGRLRSGRMLLAKAYHKVGKPLIIISLSLILMPLIAKIFLYYLWAPLIAMGKPVVIRAGKSKPVAVSQTRVAQEVLLDPGHHATIQHRFFQASDEDLHKRTQFLFSWRYPLSSMACGLFLLTRVQNESADQVRRLTLSSQDDAEIEMAIVEIPDGGSLVCRPSFLAAVVEPAGTDHSVIRSHWRFFSLHSWITMHFRYFEFHGPVKLVLWAYRGVRAEPLTEDNVSRGRERRTNQLATIGFTPALRYSSRRSETFVSYLRNQNPLFDDLFSGRGLFLCQQISRADHQRQAGKFWAQLWNALTKIVGI